MNIYQIFRDNGLSSFDVEELGTHGGSLRVFAQRADTGEHPIKNNVAKLLYRETTVGIKNALYYQSFQEQAEMVKTIYSLFFWKPRGNEKLSPLTALPPKETLCSTTPGSNRTCYSMSAMRHLLSNANIYLAAASPFCQQPPLRKIDRISY